MGSGKVSVMIADMSEDTRGRVHSAILTDMDTVCPSCVEAVLAATEELVIKGHTSARDALMTDYTRFVVHGTA